jgi:signal transduction histidine kinase
MPAPRQSARPAPSGWSLERKLPLLISALLAGVLGAFGAAAYHQVRAAAVARAEDRLGGVARQLATMSGTSGQPRIAVLRALAADTAVVRAVVGGPDAGGARAAVAARFASARQPADSTLDGWELWTADGARRFRGGRSATVADSVALAATRAAAARTDSVRRSPFYHVGGRVAVWTVVPVAAGGRTAGFLAERRRLATSPRTEQAIRQLTGEDVTLRFTSRGAGAWATVGGAPAAPLFALPAARPAGAGRVAVLPDPAGVRYYVAQEAVAQTPWLVVLAEPEAAVLRRPHEFLRTLLGVGALLLAAGAVGAWWLGRHVTRPLLAVTSAAEALAAGDYAPRVAVTGGAELARLATTFNAMAAGIGQAHAELAERNAALQRANAAKVQFLAMMSHELRTPLNAIGGYTELIELGLRGPVTPEQVTDLARIRRSKDHLLSIITDLLGFARVDAGHLTLALTAVPLRDVLADAEAALDHQFAAKGVELRVPPPPPGAVARADREKLQQVVLNLLTNALRFTAPGGAVTLTCAADADAEPGAGPGAPDDRAVPAVRLAVSDTGVGIPADKLDAIFEPFVQVDAGLTRRVGGTGLGLAIVRTLVAAMGGEVGVTSVLGAGSTFTVALPLAAAAAPPAAVAGAAGRRRGAPRLTRG